MEITVTIDRRRLKKGEVKQEMKQVTGAKPRSRKIAPVAELLKIIR